MSYFLEIELEPVVRCPLCGSGESEHFDRGQDHLLSEINRYLPADEPRFSTTYVNCRSRCTECGLIFLSPRPTANSLSDIYSRWYGYAYKRVMTDPRHIVERRREFKNYHLKMLNDACRGRGRLLDVGCGSGLFLGLAQRSGWEVTGIELDPTTAQWANVVEGIKDIRQGVISTVLKKDELFDAITIFDYLEHTDRPGADLDLLIAHLSPGGVLIIRVPNSDGFQARWMKESWLAIIPTHLSYFSRGVIAKALSDRRMDVVHISARNYRTEFDIFRQRFGWISQRLGFSRLPDQEHDEKETIAVPAIGGLRSAIARLMHSLIIEQIDHIGGWVGSGNNLAVIAKKLR